MCVYERERCRGALFSLWLTCVRAIKIEVKEPTWSEETSRFFYKVGPATTMHSGIVLPVIIYNCCIARFFAISHDCPIVNFTLIFPLCHWNGYLKRIEISIMENFYNCQMITRVGLWIGSFIIIYIFYIVECLWKRMFFFIAEAFVTSLL